MFKSLLLGVLLISGTAFASGYEKGIMFGARTAGVAGIASPYIQGPQALYFNPAGLVSDKEGHAVNADVSALKSKFKGPINDANEQAESEDSINTPFGVFYGITTDPKMGFGVGVYTSAGSAAKFEDVKINATNHGTHTVQSELSVVELALGAAYKVMDNLKIGVAWRMLMSSGQFSFVQRSTPAIGVVNAELKDLKGMNYDGLKIGAQYELSENTMIGLS